MRFNQDTLLRDRPTQTPHPPRASALVPREKPSRAVPGTGHLPRERRADPRPGRRLVLRHGPRKARAPASVARDGAVLPRPLGASLHQECFGERMPAPCTPHLCPSQAGYGAAEEGADGTPARSDAVSGLWAERVGQDSLE